MEAHRTKFLFFGYLLLLTLLIISCNNKDDVVLEDKGEFEDSRDGEIYKWVKIGNQIWMAENLRYEFGQYVTDNNEWSLLGNNNQDAAYCWYSNDISNKTLYGALYTYAAAQNACPTGWHLPTDQEWATLEDFIKNDGYPEIEGSALKSRDGWDNEGGGIDAYGFSAYPGGVRNGDAGNFANKGRNALWWSASEVTNSKAYDRRLDYLNEHIMRVDSYKSSGFSIRCIKD